MEVMLYKMEVTNGRRNKTARGEDGEQSEEHLAATPSAFGTVSSTAERQNVKAVTKVLGR